VTLPARKFLTTPRGKKDYEFTREDVELMVNSLRYSDVTLNTISTLTVDAVALDKPVVNIRFDIDPNTPSADRVELYSHFDHYIALEKTGGVKLAYSFNELVEQINAYLKNPAEDSIGRAQIRREQVEFEDSNSGKRSAEAIAKLVE
jgi:CDP-glycerol glycerophosphotransferase (TagB/SpsB family)